VGCFRCLWAARDDAGQPDKTGLLKQINGSQEGKRMRERISGAEPGLQSVPVRSNMDSWPLAWEHTQVVDQNQNRCSWNFWMVL